MQRGSKSVLMSQQQDRGSAINRTDLNGSTSDLPQFNEVP